MYIHVLLSYWVNVNAATLIFLYRRVSAVLYAQEGGSGYISAKTT